MRGVFVTGTGTEIGKTVVSRALTLAARRRGLHVAALKPIETGVDPLPLDAIALAKASGDPALADAPGLYRARQPLAPYSATLSGEAPPPSAPDLARATRDAAAGADLLLVEGAGGLLVPLAATTTVATLAQHLHLPLLLVATDTLGVLSHTLTAFEAAQARGLTVAAICLVQRAPEPLSRATNRQVLLDHLPDGVPVLTFPEVPPAVDGRLAEAAERSGLLDALLACP